MAELMFDDLPSFDDMPDAAAPETANAPLRFDDIPAFDDMPETPLQAESGPMTFARRGANSLAPGAAALAGFGAGMEVGAPLAPVTYGVGPVVTGLVGAGLAAYAASKAQHAAKDALGFNDDAQQAANEHEHPYWSAAGEVAGGAAGMGPAGSLAARGIGAGLGAVIEGGQQAYRGEFEPAKLAAQVAAGAALPGVNRVGQVAENLGRTAAQGAKKMVPGRPNVVANPAAAPAHQAVHDPNHEVEMSESSLAQTPPSNAEAQVETTGNPQSAPARSEREYAKDQPTPAEGTPLTEGQIKPDVAAALDAVEPKHEGAVSQDNKPALTPPQEGDFADVQVNDIANARLNKNLRADQQRQAEFDARQGAPQKPLQPGEGVELVSAQGVKRPTLKLPTKQVRTGFPQEGDVVAMGANDVTPQPKMPEFKGETAANAEISDAQKAAGNYFKARTRDFGKPLKIETHAGDTRSGTAPDGTKWEAKLPYDYGYFNQTKGADKDHIDFARPREGDPALGDKHFIIDQRNADTGRFDEHKVFTYYKDADAARQHYEAGFSDGKGGERLGAITEVTRPELVKFLSKHANRAATKPYDAAAFESDKGGRELKAAAAKPILERAVVKDLIAKGKTTPEKIAALPPEQVEAAIAGKRTRKYGVSTGNSAGYPVEGLLNSEGKPVTANTKAKAQARSAAHKQIEDWFTKSAPKEGESNGELLDRVKSVPTTDSWVPSHKPASWMLAREAKLLVKKPTPGNIEKFRNAERMLRGGEEAVDTYRRGNRTDADIARSRRSGDEAVANAEAKNVEQGRNSAEDEMIARIDAQREHPPEPSTTEPIKHVTKAADVSTKPSKEIDVSESSLARKAEAAKLVGKKSKAANTESEGAASEVKTKNVKVLSEAEKQRYNDMLAAALKKTPGMEALPAERAPKREGIIDLTGRFLKDESGAGGPRGNLQTFMQDLRNALKRTDHQTYMARKSEGPADDYGRELSEELHKLSQENRNHFLGALQELAKMPKELLKPKVMEDIFHARDADSAHIPLPAGQTGTHVDNLPPQIKRLYDQHLKPWLDQNDQFATNIRAIDPNRIGPDVQHHISHITKGDTSEYNMLKSKDDPTSPQYNGISVNADSAKLRKFHALVDPTGKRIVIQPTDNGFIVWRNFKPERVKAKGFEFEDGGHFTVTDKKGNKTTYEMRNAAVKEIEANARGNDGLGKPMKYYKNAGFSAAVTNVQLGSMARHLQELSRLQSTPEFAKYSTTSQAKADKLGWQPSNLPNFKGTYFHPEVKRVLDDFAGHLETPYSQLNSAITRLLFWMPTAHLMNVGAHWYVGRGWDNFTPPGMARLVKTFPKAMMSVIKQDDFQMQLRREGAGTIQGSVLTRDMMPKIAKAFQMDMVQNPSKWGPIADKLGVPLKALSDKIYDTSSKVMWAGNDMFLTQRVMELMDKGMTMKQAIIDAERDIPNYRVPTKIIMKGEKGRQLQKIATDPRILAFGRYHYGMMNSYANILKDALGPDASAGDRLDAVGKLVAMGMLGLVVYPMLDNIQKYITGNKHASQHRRGPMSIPGNLAEAAEGKNDIMAAARSTVTVPPLYTTLLETLYNKDFRGKPIVEPGEVRNAVHGSPVAAGRVLLQEGMHAAKGLVSPLNTFSNATQKNIGVAGTLRDQATDAKNPSPKGGRYEDLIKMHNQRDTLQRFRKGGSDPIEGFYNKLFGYK